MFWRKKKPQEMTMAINVDLQAVIQAKQEVGELLALLQACNAEAEKLESRSPKPDTMGDGVG